MKCGHVGISVDFTALKKQKFVLHMIHPEGGELFTVLLAGGPGGHERPGFRPRKAERWEGNSS